MGNEASRCRRCNRYLYRGVIYDIFFLLVILFLPSCAIDAKKLGFDNPTMKIRTIPGGGFSVEAGSNIASDGWEMEVTEGGYKVKVAKFSSDAAIVTEKQGERVDHLIEIQKIVSTVQAQAVGSVVGLAQVLAPLLVRPPASEPAGPPTPSARDLILEEVLRLLRERP